LGLFGDGCSSFEKSTRGRYEDRFTARELANFVEQNFMGKNEKISTELITEIFKLKQLFVGGASDSISRVEMKMAINVIGQFKTISLRLIPYMKVYSLNWETSDSHQSFEDDIRYFENANLEIQQAGKDIADIIEKNGLAYHLDSFVVLLKELSKFDNDPWLWIKDVEEAMPLVHKLKKSLAGGSEADVEPLEWRRFFLLSSRGYIQFLRYNYFINNPKNAGTAQELIYVTRSVDDLFSYLGDMVDGKPEKTLTRAELLDILQALTRFIPKLKVTDPLLIELMKVKTLLFGGRIDVFEKADFDRAREKLETFRKLAEQFIKYAKVYTLAWNNPIMTSEEKMQYFRDAEASLQQFAEKVGENLEGRYDLKDLMALARELDHFYGDENLEKRSLEERAKKLVPVLIVVKNIIFTDNDSLVGTGVTNQITRAQWRDFLGFSAQGYSKFLYFNYFVKGQSISSGEGLAQAEAFVAEATAYLEKILARKKSSDNQITFVELGNLLAVFESAEILPNNMTAASLNSVVKAVFQRMLITPERRLGGAQINGLSQEALVNLRGEFAIWAGGQRFNDWLYKGIPAEQGRPGSEVNAALAGGTSEGLKELKMIYGSGLDVAFDSLGRMRISKPGAYYLRSTADYINLIRQGARMVLRGYGGDLTRIKNYEGITLPELKLLYADIRGLLAEMNLISPTNKTFADARFRDGNLFTSNSNGDSYLSFKEVTHLAMMITSGLKIDSFFYKEIEHQCPINHESRYKDDWTIEFKCLTPFYKARLLENFSSMPEMARYIKAMDKDAFDDFYLNMMKAAGYAPESGPLVKLGDLSQFPHVTQYVEIIFQQYDVDRDGYLNTQEAMKAFPTFRNILLEASKGKLKSDKKLKGLFTWLLKYAKAPEGTTQGIKFLLWWVPKGEKGWVVSADRGRLAKILGFIADSTAAAEREKLQQAIPDDQAD
jgi:hypothetical protein